MDVRAHDSNPRRSQALWRRELGCAVQSGVTFPKAIWAMLRQSRHTLMRTLRVLEVCNEQARAETESVKASMTRDHLSFTARIPRGDGLDCPLLSNWSPVEVPYQQGQWSIGHVLGAKMIDELACLADVGSRKLRCDSIRDYCSHMENWRTRCRDWLLRWYLLTRNDRPAVSIERRLFFRTRIRTEIKNIVPASVCLRMRGEIQKGFRDFACVVSGEGVGLIDCGTYEKGFAEIKRVEQARAR